MLPYISYLDTTELSMLVLWVIFYFYNFVYEIFYTLYMYSGTSIFLWGFTLGYLDFTSMHSGYFTLLY